MKFVFIYKSAWASSRIGNFHRIKMSIHITTLHSDFWYNYLLLPWAYIKYGIVINSCHQGIFKRLVICNSSCVFIQYVPMWNGKGQKRFLKLCYSPVWLYKIIFNAKHVTPWFLFFRFQLLGITRDHMLWIILKKNKITFLFLFVFKASSPISSYKLQAWFAWLCKCVWRNIWNEVTKYESTHNALPEHHVEQTLIKTRCCPFYLPPVFENGGRYCFGVRRRLRRLRRLRRCFALYLGCY